MTHEAVYPRCGRCGKAVYPTWSTARRALADMVRQRKAARGFIVYRSRQCQAIRIGRATNHTRRRYQRKDFTS